MCSSHVVGEVVYFGAMKQVHLLDCETLTQMCSVETTEWVFALCMLDEQTLICGQSYGYIDIVRVHKSRGTGLISLQVILKTKFEQVSHIFSI